MVGERRCWLRGVCTVLCFAACSGDDGTTSGGARIGALLPVTGPFAEVGVTAEGATDLAVQEINDQGGVWGRDLQVEYRDSRSDAAQAEKQARQLIGGRNIRIILASDSVPAVKAVLDEAAESDTVVLTSLAGDPALAEDGQGRFFRTLPVRDLLPRWATWWNSQLYAEGQRRILYVHNELIEEVPAVAAEDFLAQCTEAECQVELRPYPQNASPAELKSLVADLRDSPPDVLTVFGLEQEVVAILQAAQDARYQGTIMVNDAFALVGPTFISLLQPATVARVRWVDAAPNKAADATTYAMRYQRLNGAWSSLGRAEFATYDAMFVAGLALERARENLGPTIADAMREVANPPGTKVGPFEFKRARELISAGKDIDYEGLVLRDFDDDGENTLQPDAAFYGWDPQGRVVPWMQR